MQKVKEGILNFRFSVLVGNSEGKNKVQVVQELLFTSIQRWFTKNQKYFRHCMLHIRDHHFLCVYHKPEKSTIPLGE
jgi:hypothetical protein